MPGVAKYRLVSRAIGDWYDSFIEHGEIEVSEDATRHTVLTHRIATDSLECRTYLFHLLAHGDGETYIEDWGYVSSPNRVTGNLLDEIGRCR